MKERDERSLGQQIAEFPLVALVVAVALYLAARALGFWIGSLVRVGVPASSIVRAAITISITLGMYKLVIARLGKHPRDELCADRSVAGFVTGIMAGALLFAAVVAIAALLGVYRVTGSGASTDLAVPLITTAVTPAVMEELLFRGIFFRWTEEFAGSWIALVVTSTLFGLAHILNPGATWFSSFAVAVEAGLMLGGAYMFSRSLWMPIGLHAAWNFAQGPVFGLPVSGIPSQGLLKARLSGPVFLSGGSFGLEASTIAIVLCTGVGSWFLWQVATDCGFVRPCWIRPQKASTS